MACRLTFAGLIALLVFGASGLAVADSSGRCAEANQTAEPQWNCYAFYDPVIEHVTIYDAELVTVGDDPEDIQATYMDRIIDSRKDKVLKCAVNAEDNINPDCVVNEKNRQVINWYWYQFRMPSIYNHMSALAFFDGSWFAVWGANDKRTPNKHDVERLTKEGKIPEGQRIFPKLAYTEALPGQRVVLSKSPQKANSPAGRRDAFREGWTDPDSPDVPLELSKRGLFHQQLLWNTSKPYDPETNPENPDTRQWAPELLVVDADPDPDNRREELWAFFTQNLSRGRGTYFARLQHSAQNPDAEWSVKRIDLAKTSLDPRSGIVFVSPNAVQLKHQPEDRAYMNGWVLVPVTPQNETDKEVKNDLSVLYTKDGGETWNAFPRIIPTSNYEVWEPIIVENPVTGDLFIYARNRERADVPSSELLVYSSSRDGGKTWSPLEPMPLEVPSLRPHGFAIGDRIVMVHHDFESRFTREKGAREGVRTGRETNSGPGGIGTSDRLNMALFFSRTGEIGSFLPGIAFTNNQRTTRSDDDQRGTSYPHMVVVDDTLYIIHTSERSIRGEIIYPLPPDDTYLLYPRSTVEIYKKGTPGWDSCPADDPNVNYNRDDLFDSSLCTYTYSDDGQGLGTLTKQASISVESDTADYAADDMLQFQFDFAGVKPKKRLKPKQRIALLTIGGPDEYGMIEIGRPKHAGKVVYTQGGKIHVLGDYENWGKNFGTIDVFLHKEGVTLKLNGNDPVTVPKPIEWQKLFLGYGYLQGPAYKEHLFNPRGRFSFHSDAIGSRIVQGADLQAILNSL